MATPESNADNDNSNNNNNNHKKNHTMVGERMRRRRRRQTMNKKKKSANTNIIINPLLWIQVLLVIVSCFLFFLAYTAVLSEQQQQPQPQPQLNQQPPQPQQQATDSPVLPRVGIKEPDITVSQKKKSPEGGESSKTTTTTTTTTTTKPSQLESSLQQQQQQQQQQTDKQIQQQLPDGFQRILQRAEQFQSHCDSMNLVPRNKEEEEQHLIELPPFGIIDALRRYQNTTATTTATQQHQQQQHHQQQHQCHAPPATECGVHKFTVIFLGFSFQRLDDVKLQLRRMLAQEPYRFMVEEVVLVWNNPIPINSTHDNNNNAHDTGTLLYQWSTRPNNPFLKDPHNQHPNPFRIFYPIQDLGLPSSLMNRYHPAIKPKSKALLYYDDDGPFYVYKAILSAFELWRRNSDTQMGAMTRAFTLGPRQTLEKEHLLLPQGLDDRKFVSHCGHSDVVAYDYRFFCNFHANMVLPSGSFLHRNYLCFIWHPALAELRDFVFRHVVHPDDMTVSAIVSHISGRAPMPYSRRLPEKRRRLGEEATDPHWPATETTAETIPQRRFLVASSSSSSIAVANETSPEGMWRTKDWGKLRSIALNNVISYFGGINSGSYGWCYNTKWHKQNKERHICEPDIAREHMLPWMQPGGYGNDVCPTMIKTSD